MLRELVGHQPVKLIAQSWDDCPLPVDYKKNQACWGGSSLWKFCPARLNINCHEIICDNDVVLIKKIDKIDEFLSSSKVLMVADPIKYQGIFNRFFTVDERYNAGFIGIPPQYDMKEELCKMWIENNSPQALNQADEQGLATAALKKHEFLTISKEEMMLIHPNGGTDYKYYDAVNERNYYDEVPVDFYENGSSAYHFVRINKVDVHLQWEQFKATMKKKTFI